MQEPMMYPGVPFPVQPSQMAQTGGQRGGWRLLLVVLLLIALVVAGMSWLQWASQRGLLQGYPQPTVHIISSPSGTILLNQGYQFAASSNGRDLTYNWNFGDQNTEAGANVSHAYQANGNYTVSVTVTDPLGQSSTASSQVSVLPPPPQAAFTFSVGYYGYVTFDASNSSADASTSIATFQWDFGDGNSDQTSYPQDTHTYANYGYYTVTLTVIDATGQQSQPDQSTVSI